MNGRSKSLIGASAEVALARADGGQAPAFDPAGVALGLIHSAGVATRDQEERVAHAITGMEQIIREHQERLDTVEKRASDAEAALEQAQEEIKALIARLGDARDSLAGLKDLVLATESKLAAMNARGEAAQRQALDMSAVLSMLIEEIKTKLPTSFAAGP